MTPERRNLTDDEREAILREVLLRSNGSYITRLPKGFSQELADKYKCHVSTIRRVLAVAKQQGIGGGNMKVTVASKMKGRVGRKKAFTAEQVKAKLLQVPLAQRTTLRSISERTGISLGSLHRYLKLGLFRSHSNAIKPLLTDANKYGRMKHAVEFVGSTLELNDMLQFVHLDEKWFYITKVSRKYYLVPGEKEPKRECKSKQYITKVMFLCAVARPRYNHATDSWWDGKIGIWPFVEPVAAQRDSVNRKAGTLETKSITVTKDVYRTFLLDKVLPAIVAKWPRADHTIKLQHDNARAHVTPEDAKLKAALDTYKAVGWHMSLAPQPPNSPDTNVLDLGVFAAIQSLQHRKSARTIDELVGHVESAFVEYPLARLNHTFMTLQSCLVETLKLFGDNAYKVPHMSKEKEERKGMLPQNVSCPRDVFEAAKVRLDGVAYAKLDCVLAAELEEARCIDELAQALETIALDDDEPDDIISALCDAGIDPISVEDDE
ncbi:hypothetical protein AaE_014395 [Aphanomyces astaci]|uniref:Tc1-like transposase DDE domain-containing protein n=2 Tax=Aphanomyces astaci TaxID=112090 RepID=A0A6A4Z7H9_APHAT|nr:hypothetical protein AaE_014395 [Aphanomyces astaci]